MQITLGPSASASSLGPDRGVPRTAAGRKAGPEMEDFRAVPPARRVSEGLEGQKFIAPGGDPTNPSSEMARSSHNELESMARC